MASSFVNQIPTVVYVLGQLNPKTVLDVGKGFGKCGFLLHEYVGIDNTKKPDPHRTLAQQSRITIDAVEVNPSYQWPHISQFYRDVYLGRVEELCDNLPAYDVVLMADVIEHIEKTAALRVVDLFLSRGSTLLISTPRKFFQQELFESPDEHHVSFWTIKDFQKPDRTVLYQKLESGVIYVVKQGKMAKIRGFGNDPMWKPEHRQAADRSGLRYPSDLTLMEETRAKHRHRQLIRGSRPLFGLKGPSKCRRALRL